jgi:hypothetical protein
MSSPTFKFDHIAYGKLDITGVQQRDTGSLLFSPLHLELDPHVLASGIDPEHSRVLCRIKHISGTVWPFLSLVAAIAAMMDDYGTVVCERSGFAMPGKPVSPHTNGTLSNLLQGTQQATVGLPPSEVGDRNELREQLMSIDRDSIPYYIVFGKSRRPHSSILVCSGTGYVPSTMSLLHSELRFVTLRSKPSKQASKLLHLAKITIHIVDL